MARVDRDKGSVRFEIAPGHCHVCGKWCERLLRRWNTIRQHTTGEVHKTDLCFSCAPKYGGEEE